MKFRYLTPYTIDGVFAICIGNGSMSNEPCFIALAEDLRKSVINLVPSAMAKRFSCVIGKASLADKFKILTHFRPNIEYTNSENTQIIRKSKRNKKYAKIMSYYLSDYRTNHILSYDSFSCSGALNGRVQRFLSARGIQEKWKIKNIPAT